MTQDPTTQTLEPNASETQGRDPITSGAGKFLRDNLYEIWELAEKERTRFELDPRGYVEKRVQTRLHHMRRQGRIINREQERRAEHALAGLFQEEAGISPIRLLSNQQRADRVQSFQAADLAARVDMMKDFESAFLEDWPKVYGEFVEGLPLDERPGARRLFERFQHHRLHSVDPAVGLNIDDWSGQLDDLATLAAYSDARNFGAPRSASVPDKGDGAPRQPELSEIGGTTSASPNSSVTPGVTDDWTGPGLDAERSAFLADLVDQILAAPPEDLPILEERIAAAFADDPFTVRRLIGLAHARLGEGSDFLELARQTRIQEAEAALRGLRDRLSVGWDYSAQRREDREAFAALEATTSFRLRLRSDGKIAIGEPDQPPLALVSWSVARAIARNPEKVRERFALIDRLITSQEPDQALRDKVDQVLDLVTGPALVLDSRDTPYEPLSVKETREAVFAARAAIRESANPDAVRAGLIATFFPEVAEDPIAWGELLLDVLPIIGEIRSAGDAIESFDAMAEALARGDLDEAAKQGLLGALSAAGALPALGPLFKTLRTLTRRALRTRRVAVALRTSDRLKALHGKFAVAQRRGRMPEFIRHITAEEAFAEVWPQLSADQKKLLKGLMPHFKGKPVELEFKRLLENAGIDLVTTGQDKLLLASGKKTVLDAVSRNGFSDGVRIFANSFILPTPGAKGTIFEFKMGDAPPSTNQMAGKAEVEQANASGQMLRTMRGSPVVDHEVLRYGFNEVPEDVIEREAERLLRNHANGVRSKRLSHADVDELVQVFVSWHRQLRHDTAGEVMTVAEAFIALGIAASERAARKALESVAEESEPEN